MLRGIQTTFLIALLCASALADAPDTTQPTAAPSPAVAALISQMSSDDFGERTSAQTRLVAMGQSVIPQLRQALSGDLPDETRARLNAAITQIQDNVLLGPSYITMHYKDAPLQTVLDDFAAQAGADMGVNRPRNSDYSKTRTASIDLDHADFWQALRAIEDVSGLQLSPYSNAGGGMMLEINPGIFPDFEMFSDGACTSGPVRVFAQSCTDNRTIQYGRGGGRKQSTFMLMLVAVPEPKLRIAGQLNGDWLTECIDERGHSLLSEQPQQGYAGNGRQWWWQLQAMLRESPDMGHKIATLRGVLKFNVECKLDVTETDIGKINNVSRTVGTSTVTLRELKDLAGQYQLVLDINNPSINGRNMWDAVNNIASSIEILDSTGQSFMQAGLGPQMQPDGKTMRVIVNYISPHLMNGPALGPPVKLKWEVATETRQLTIPFVIHNLDLPTAP
jgi:hypothetical protein